MATGANRYDAPLLDPTLARLDPLGPLPDTTVHLDRGYDSGVTRPLLAELGFTGTIVRQGLPAPLQVGKRRVVDFSLFLAATVVALLDPACAIPVPLARSPNHPAAQVMPIAGRSKAS